MLRGQCRGLIVLACVAPRSTTKPSSSSVKRGIAAASMPCPSSRSPMLYIEISVLGWQSPSVSLLACSASSISGLASSSLPIACSS
eukprot:scaffold57787_cov61-Phaeocystis_antarctica.AAC.1